MGPMASALKVSTPKPDAGDEHSDPGDDQRPFSLEMGIGEIDGPWKINMEPETDGLEDDVPFQLGDF